MPGLEELLVRDGQQRPRNIQQGLAGLLQMQGIGGAAPIPQQAPMPQPQMPNLAPSQPFYNVRPKKGGFDRVIQGTVEAFNGTDHERAFNEQNDLAGQVAYKKALVQRLMGKQKLDDDLYLQQQRQLGQGTQAANQAGTAINDDPSRGPLGPWSVKRDPYTGDVKVWEKPITERQQQHREYTRFDPEKKEEFKVDAQGKEIPNSRKPLVSDFQNDKEGFNRALDLGSKWYAESKPYFGAKEAYNNLLAAAEDPSPAGDIALIFAFMKTLDPTSVVKEGEFATAENAGSVPEAIRNKYNRVIAGERLGATRQDFVNQGTKAFERKRKQQEIVNKRWQRKAQAFKVDPTLVVDEAEMEMPQSKQTDQGNGQVVPQGQYKIIKQ